MSKRKYLRAEHLKKLLQHCCDEDYINIKIGMNKFCLQKALELDFISEDTEWGIVSANVVASASGGWRNKPSYQGDIEIIIEPADPYKIVNKIEEREREERIKQIIKDN